MQTIAEERVERPLGAGVAEGGFAPNRPDALAALAVRGMVNVAPPGDEADPTRQRRFYDETHDYRAALGLPSA